MPFVGEIILNAREVYVVNYSFPLSVPNGGFCVYYPLNTFQHMGTNVYEQLTDYGVGGSLFSVLWNDFMRERYMFLLL